MLRLLGPMLLLGLVSLPSGWAASRLDGTKSLGALTVREEVLGNPPLLWVTASTVASEDGQHVALVVRHGLKSAVWHDGVEGSPYQRIGPLTFSPHGSHLAYIATKNEETDVVVLDGKELVTQTSCSPNSLQFSPDGKRIAYVAARPTNEAVTIPPVTATASGDGQPHRFGAITPLFVVLDGQPGRVYFSISTRELVFSPDSQHLAYSASLVPPTNPAVSLECVVRDGVESEAWEEIRGGTLTFSSDSRHLAFAARRQGKWHVVVDGKPGRAYDRIATHSLAFAPNSDRLVYLAERDGKRFPIDAGEEIGPAGIQDPCDAQLSPDGSHLAYWATRNGKRLWLINHKPAAEYDELGPLLFSPDSHRTAYAARRGGRWHMVLDGTESQACEEISGSFQFSPNSGHLVWFAKRQGKYRLVYDLQEQGREYDFAGRFVGVSPDSRHVAFAAARGPATNTDQGLIVVDGREEAPAYGLIKLAFNGNRTLHAIAVRMNPESFKDEIVRLELLISEGSVGLGEIHSP